MIFKGTTKVTWIARGQRAIYQVYKAVRLVWSKLADAWYDNDVWRSDEQW